MKVVEASTLSFRYGTQAVLHGVAFPVTSGDFFVIIGPNGSGKTTLLKLLARLAVPQSGTVHLFGKNLAAYGRRELARLVAVVPQQVPLDFPFTVAETVLMGRAPHLGLLELEKAEDYDLAAEAMRFTDVLHLADRRLDQLSGGERQRVIIARAICQQPRLLLLDEPTASLDPAHQVQIMDLLERLRAANGVTVVMVSHDLNLAAMYGTTLLLLQGGTIVQVGTPDQVLRSEILAASYGCAMQVEKNPLLGVPLVLPVPGKATGRTREKTRGDD